MATTIEELERRRGERLEVRGRMRARDRREQREDVVESAGGDVAVRDPEPLRHVDEVRRGVEPDLEPGRVEEGGGHRRGRALPVRAADQDRAEGLLRMSERGEESARLREAGPDLLRAERLEPRQAG